MTDLEIELKKNAEKKMWEYLEALFKLNRYQSKKEEKNEEEKSGIQRPTNLSKNSTENACY